MASYNDIQETVTKLKCSFEQQNMVEPIFLSTVSPAIKLILTILDAAFKNKLTHIDQRLAIEVQRTELEKLVKETKGVFDKGKVLNCKLLKDLAGTLAEAETYGDIINYIFNNKLYCDLGSMQNTLHQLLENLRNLNIKLPENQSSGLNEKLEIPLRRCVLYLSCFPKGFVYNQKRITRLFVALGFIPAGSSKPLLQELAKVAEGISEGEMDPYYIPIGNDVEKGTQTWPQSLYFREFVVDSLESIKGKQFIPSLIVFGGRNHTFKFEKNEFILLRILSLRNVKLENEKYLKQMSFLKHLDLKYTHVRDCRWLEALEELQMLDLRYTLVEEIPDKYLENLGKLQHLLLGYHPSGGVSRLAGVKLNTEKLKSNNLETLRAIRRPDVIGGSVDKVVDLSVTGLDTERLKNFWHAVGKFQKLTSLGVSVTENTVITLKDCPDNLKNKLERLRMEGQMFSISGLAKLSEFNLLIDLTLVSDKPIIDSIPTLTSLLCLRLYGYKEKICKIGLEKFESLKKVLIGDMENVEKIQMSSAVIGRVTTLKLCNLPNFSELACLDTCLNTEHPLLIYNPGGNERFKNIQSHKTIFLKGFGYKPIQKSPRLKIYRYDMDKQCYKELI